MSNRADNQVLDHHKVNEQALRIKKRVNSAKIIFYGTMSAWQHETLLRATGTSNNKNNTPPL